MTLPETNGDRSFTAQATIDVDCGLSADCTVELHGHTAMRCDRAKSEAYRIACRSGRGPTVGVERSDANDAS